MLKVICYDSDGKKLDRLTQWDIGQTVSVSGLTDVNRPQFHFCNKMSQKAYVVDSKDQGGKIIADIPNDLLREPYPVDVYIYYYKTQESGKTVFAFSIPVSPRKCPDDYVYKNNIEYVSLTEIKKEAQAALEELRASIQESKDTITQVNIVSDEAKKATAGAIKATESATTAASNATTSAQAADKAAASANNAASSATTAAEAATLATNNADTATQKATAATTSANNAAARAEQATSDVNAAKDAARSAADKATQAATSANTAAGKADKATIAANEAAGSANNAASSATTAAGKATEATNQANTATASANDAASKANAAASAATNATTDLTKIKEAAVAATTKATEATTAATTATGSANKAATDANAAAKAANDAAEKARVDVASKLDKPTAAPKVNNVLKVESVQPDGTFTAVWSDPPASVVVDDTLKNAGQAADAAKTGTEIKRLDDAKENVIIKKDFGATISLTDSADAPLAGLKLFGKTTQAGTPAPEAPIPLVSPGDSGNIVVRVCGKNLFDIKRPDKAGYIIDPEGHFIENREFNCYKIKAKADKQLTISYKKGPRFDAFRYGIEINGVIERKVYSSGETITVSGCDFLWVTINPDEIYQQNVQVEYGPSPTGYEPYNGGTLTIPTPNGLPGIKVSSGGDYTDSTGQQWVCDEVDLERGVYVKRVSADKISALKYEVSFNSVSRFSKDISVSDNTLLNTALFTHLPFVDANYSGDYEHFYIWNYTIYVFLRNEIAKNQNEIDAWLLKNNPMVVYALKDPIETPLTQEQLTAFAALHTNYPNTNIINDSECEMAVSYFTDTDTGRYIAKLQDSVDDALLVTGGDMTGPIKMNGQQITGLTDPTDETDAARKGYVDGKVVSMAVTLLSGGWSGNTQIVAAVGVTADASKTDVLASPAPEQANRETYNECGVWLVEQLDGRVKFQCETVPSKNLTVNLLIHK